ncbi:dynamin family protein [Streptomyces sp. NPDC051771]|uniref:dynamin family protein n=1 Tax=Streptomyces sp. NPDC051771 TaxID=3154847 RepID=UPI003436F6EE
MRDRADGAFAAALDAVGESPALHPLAVSLRTARERMAGPLRVALVGRVSAGKSTLVNALLGEEIAPTGITDLTFTVTWLTHGPERTVAAHFGDGRPPVPFRPGELAGLAGGDRADGRARPLHGVDHLLVTDPHPRLAAFDLIDTPGLDSAFESDSLTTLRLLGRSDAEVRAASAAHAGQADALIAVIPCQGLSENLRTLLADLRGGGFAEHGPISTVGALTKVERLWPDHPDPLRRGAELAAGTLAVAGTDRVLFALRPVAALLACGAATMTEDMYADLLALAPLAGRASARPGRDLLAVRLSRGPQWEQRDDPDLPVPPERRRPLSRRLSPYGVHLACRLLYGGEAADLPALRRALVARSGIGSFTGLLERHFGGRADLVRLRGRLDHVYEVRSRPAGRLSEPDRLRADAALAPLLALDQDEPGFLALEVLRDHYRGLLGPGAGPGPAVGGGARGEELARVLGEHGPSPASRLGLPADAGPAQVLDAARAGRARWAAAAADPGHGGRSRRAVAAVLRAYEELASVAAAQVRAEAREGRQAALPAAGGSAWPGTGAPAAPADPVPPAAPTAPAPAGTVGPAAPDGGPTGTAPSGPGAEPAGDDTGTAAAPDTGVVA